MSELRAINASIRWEEAQIKLLKKDVKSAENEARYKKLWIISSKDKLKELKERRDKLQ